MDDIIKFLQAQQEAEEKGEKEFISPRYGAKMDIPETEV